VGLVISIFCVILVLHLLQRYFQKSPFKSSSTLNRPSVQTAQTLAGTATLGKQYLYVLGNLLSQGSRSNISNITIEMYYFQNLIETAGPCASNHLPFRIVAGAWSLAAFIFVQAYTSTLSTYVLTPINNPLINSPYEIPERKDIHLLIKKGGSTDTFLSASFYLRRSFVNKPLFISI